MGMGREEAGREILNTFGWEASRWERGSEGGSDDRSKKWSSRFTATVKYELWQNKHFPTP